MAIDSKHPSYEDALEDWTLMRDAHAGERKVKAKGTEYLPATPAHEADGMEAGKKGAKSYAAYLKRAKFPDYVSEAVSRYIGLLHQKDAEIELPAALEPLRERATPSGEGLLALLRRINTEQLITGRLGLMLDLPLTAPTAQPGLPYVALYVGEAVRNWDESADGEGLNKLFFTVLDETSPVRERDFTWTTRERYRVLVLSPAQAQPAMAAEHIVDEPPPEGGVAEADDQGAEAGEVDVTEAPVPLLYMQAVIDVQDKGRELDPSLLLTPMYRGKPLDKLPFVFVNACDLTPEPDKPPLLGLGRDCMAIYRGEADYRHTLFMQGQETFVTIGTVTQNGEHVGTDDELRVGAGAHIALDTHGDAKYVGIGSEGLSEQREALESDRKEAESKSAMLVSPSAGKQESGDALSTRLTAQTANLTRIAHAGAEGLQRILRIAAEWVGADPNAVKVTPNLEFAPLLVTGQEVAQLMGAKAMGAPLSKESIHGVLRDRGLTKFDYETELAKIEEEDGEEAKRQAELNKALGLDAAGNPIEPGGGPGNGPGGPQGGPQGGPDDNA